MLCLICRDAQTVSGVASINFERDEFRAVVHQVPAQVCPTCGESYLDEDVTVALLQRLEKILAEGEMDVVQAFV
jgi:YgiT-type zinc finger domain-containing protein